MNSCPDNYDDFLRHENEQIQNIAGECACCGDYLYSGETAYKLDGETYCDCCIDASRFEIEEE